MLTYIFSSVIIYIQYIYPGKKEIEREGQARWLRG